MRRGFLINHDTNESVEIAVNAKSLSKFGWLKLLQDAGQCEFWTEKDNFEIRNINEKD